MTGLFARGSVSGAKNAILVRGEFDKVSECKVCRGGWNLSGSRADGAAAGWREVAGYV